MRHEKAMTISGIYKWGEGITQENRKKWEEEVSSFANITKLDLRSPYGVQEHEENDLSIFFHPSETVFKGKNSNRVKELYILFDMHISGSKLPISTSLKWEKIDGVYQN